MEMEIDGQADDQGHTLCDMASAMDRIITLLMASRPDLDFEDGDVLTFHIAVCEHLRAHSFEASRTQEQDEPDQPEVVSALGEIGPLYDPNDLLVLFGTN